MCPRSCGECSGGDEPAVDTASSASLDTEPAGRKSSKICQRSGCTFSDGGVGGGLVLRPNASTDRESAVNEAAVKASTANRIFCQQITRLHRRAWPATRACEAV